MAIARFHSLDDAAKALTAIVGTSERASWVERKRSLAYPVRDIPRIIVRLLNANSDHVVALIFGQEDDGTVCGQVATDGLTPLSKQEVTRLTDSITQMLSQQKPPIIGRWDEVVIGGKLLHVYLARALGEEVVYATARGEVVVRSGGHTVPMDVDEIARRRTLPKPTASPWQDSTPNSVRLKAPKQVAQARLRRAIDEGAALLSNIETSEHLRHLQSTRTHQEQDDSLSQSRRSQHSSHVGRLCRWSLDNLDVLERLFAPRRVVELYRRSCPYLDRRFDPAALADLDIAEAVHLQTSELETLLARTELLEEPFTHKLLNDGPYFRVADWKVEADSKAVNVENLHLRLTGSNPGTLYWRFVSPRAKGHNWASAACGSLERKALAGHLNWTWASMFFRRLTTDNHLDLDLMYSWGGYWCCQTFRWPIAAHSDGRPRLDPDTPMQSFFDVLEFSSAPRPTD